MADADSARPPGAGNPLSLDYIAGLQRCRIRVRPDQELGAVELAVVAADGSGRCLLALPSVYKLCAALLTAAGALRGEGGAS